MKAIVLSLSFLVLGHPVYAINCAESFSKPRLTTRDALEKSIDQFEKRFGERPDTSDFRIVGLSVRYKGDRRPVRLRLYFRDRAKPIAVVYYSYSQKTLRFDIRVEKEFHRLGLYQYLLAVVLEKHPRLQSLPAYMGIRESLMAAISDNALVFFEAAFRHTDPFYFPHFDIEGTSIVRRKEVRGKLINAFFEMPSTKVRQRLGIRDVSKIAVDMQRGTIAFEMLRGERRSLDDILVVLRTDRGTYELKANGKFRRRAAKIFELGDYDLLHRSTDPFEL